MKIYAKPLYFIIIILILYAGLLATDQPAGAAAPTPGPNTTGQIWGRALMPDGATGIPGCEVRLLWKNDLLLAQTISDDDGNFYFTMLQPNDDTWSYRLVIRRGDWGETTTQQFPVMADSATTVHVKVFPYIGSLQLSASDSRLCADDASRVTLTATLFDVNGAPVPDGMQVELTQGSYYGNPGKFYSGALNGTDITLTTHGGTVQAQYGDVPGDTLSRSVQITATCIESPASRSLNLTLDLVNPNVIRGTVYDATGRPVPYAKVFLYRWDGARFVGYNSTETGNRTDGSGICDANGSYRYAVLPPGDYRVNASESTFAGSSRVSVVRGTYNLDIGLPMGRGSIRGWVKDNEGNAVSGATVSLLRFYGSDLSLMATNTTAADGSFSFDDVWHGKYDVQVVCGNQTADMPVTLDENRTSVTVPLLHAVDINPGASASPGPGDGIVTPGPSTKATPKPPTPTPPPVTLSYMVSSYGVAMAVMVVIAAGIFMIAMRMRR